MTTKKNINLLIQLLADGQFYSGEWLGEQLGVTRTSISNYIKHAEALGLDIHSVKGKGYKLVAPIELLDEALIRSLSEQKAVDVFPVLDSTNQYLLDRLDQLTPGATCMAECQTAGRGRRGRQWVSPFGSHLYLSMYWQLEAGMGAAMGLSLVTGIATVNALESLGVSGVQLKWPNDIYVAGKKLAGILVEMSAQAAGPCQLVIGLGLNVKMPAAAAEGIDQPWTDLHQMGTSGVGRNQLAARLIMALEQSLSLYEQAGLEPFLTRWQALDAFINQPVNLIIGPKTISGIARGIDAQGALLVEQHGVIKPFIGGEISLRLAHVQC
ncbi:bifunctional biotin--[acetyl-CoA-carboxylase] ligase/biotin operon repressor BirA [Motilimonas sp. E26]|uniref:bifunctional biotin--[acetyl-CoA-carboxylase] ligase/biotin operon repressor BirA n=1 Tax=Motilimonas sp. E26 TaxID=2865674 RepID=UPI001E2FA491|nr:bifunctional biotin--[acetyl-CoA-carboxylase] ligase/biotin operon repressor BirA [Motilimonas sp. E26]MCE0556515.1 bifunctional biotin--[acetyl-CoA-carboxylase] ligase/biotin operon repressor BirA [Motilimonas sp. E26]